MRPHSGRLDNMLIKKASVLILAILLAGLLAKSGFSAFASAAQQKEGVGKVIEVEVITIPDDGDAVEIPFDPPIISMVGGCGVPNKTGASAESALYVHQAGNAGYARHQSMADAAMRVPFIFNTKRASQAEYLTNPNLGMANMSDPNGRSRVTLKFHIETVDADAFKAKALYFIENYEADYIYAADGSLRQLLTDDTLTDIIPLPANEEGYVIRTYRRLGQVGAFVNGEYEILGNGVPYLEAKVYNPTWRTYTGDIRVRVTERFSAGSEVTKIYSWHIDDVTHSTTYEELHPDPTTQPLVYHPWRRTVLTRSIQSDEEYSQIREQYEAETPASGATGAPQLALISREYEKYKFIGTDKRLVLQMSAVDAAGSATAETLMTEYTYFQDTGKPLLDGRPHTVVSSDGMWTSYDYNLDDVATGIREYKKYTPFMNSLIGDLPNARLETVTTDGDSYTRIVTIAGQQVSKGVQSTVSGATKLVIKTERYMGSAAPLVSYVAFNSYLSTDITSNRVHSRIDEDGSVALYSYTDLGGRKYSEVIQSGAGIQDGSGVVTSVDSGTETTTEYNAHGQAYQASSMDIASGLALRFWSAIDPVTGTSYQDEFGRATKKFFNGNADDSESWSYLCCGLEESISRTGVVTTYERDPLKRITKTSVARSSAAPLVDTINTYSGLTTTVERASGGSILLVSETRRSLGGLTTTQWTPDADGLPGPNTPPNPDYQKAERTVREVIFDPNGGLVIKMTAPDGTETATSTYFDGSRSQSTDQEGQVTTYLYGTHNEQGGGLWSKLTSPIPTQWIKTYSDALDRKMRTEYPDGALVKSSYYAASAPVGSPGKLFTSEDADENLAPGSGSQVSYAYNAEGGLATTTEILADGHSRITTTQRDVVPNITIKQTTLATAIRSTREVNGVLVSTSYASPDGYFTASDSLTGQTLSTRSVPDDGFWYVAGYNADGQRTVTGFQAGLRSSVSYTENDDTTVVATNTYTHDNFARLLDTVDLRTGVTSVQSRMANGAVASQVSNGGADTTAYAYDTMGRVTTTTLPDGSTTHTSYTARGQTLAIWGSQTYARLYQYDSLGRMSELRTYQDLAYGVQPTVSTVGFAKTTWHYDGQRGWLTEKNYDGETGDGPGGAADYTYTLAGRLKTRTWERGVVTTYGYDQGALESVVYSNDPTGTAGVTYTYDAFGRSSTVGQGGNLHTYGYDAGSLMLDTETIAYDTDGNGAADFTRVLDMTQDALLRATGHLLKDGATIENAVVYTYDGAGRLQTVGGAGQSGSAGFLYEYETNAVALLKEVTGPVHTVTNGYEDHRNVLANKENMNAAGTNLISEFTYTTNSIGQRTHLTTNGSAYTSAPVYSWAYNGRGELIEASDTSSANNDRAFQYDGIGNREKTVDGLLPALPALPNYAATSQNQYASIGVLSPSYDADGNATGYPLPAAPGQLSTLVWNGENRLISATVAGTTSTYSYDYRGRRISKQVGATPATRYIYEGWNVIAEYAGSTIDRSYTWGMDLSGSMQGAGGVGGLLAVHIGTENYFPTYDGNGNVGEYLDPSGAVAAHFEYDAFGNVTVSTSSAGAPTFAHRFSTKPLDGETGLYYYGKRSYDPEDGRWLSRDPIVEEGGINLYGFTKNSAVNDWDVLGMEYSDFAYFGNFEFRVHGEYGGPGWTNGRRDPGSRTPANQVGPPFGPEPTDFEDSCYLTHDIDHKVCSEKYPVNLVTITRWYWPDSEEDCNEDARAACKALADRVLADALYMGVYRGQIPRSLRITMTIATFKATGGDWW